jgi:hypothetical protein
VPGLGRGELAGGVGSVDVRDPAVQIADPQGGQFSATGSAVGRQPDQEQVELAAMDKEMVPTRAAVVGQRFEEGVLGPWLFSHRLDHEDRLGATTLGHRFAELRTAAQVPDASLHRLRHNVASFLVARGQILQAQARLGHADAATTLREYAYALPLTDEPVADALDRHLNCLAENLTTAETER